MQTIIVIELAIIILMLYKAGQEAQQAAAQAQTYVAQAQQNPLIQLFGKV
jgi:hypothetical protein